MAVFGWGIAGAAIATVVSQMASAVLVLWVLTFRMDDCRLRWRGLGIDRQMTNQILKIGLPVGFQQAVIAFSNVFVQAYVNAFDTACIAGWGCYSKLDQYMMLPIQSMGQAVTTFVGQNLGAKQQDRAKKSTLEAFCLTLGISIAVAIILWTFAASLTGLFIQDDETIYFGTLFIRLCVPFAVLCCFNQVFSGALRGAGKSQGPNGDYPLHSCAFPAVISCGNHQSSAWQCICGGIWVSGWLDSMCNSYYAILPVQPLGESTKKSLANRKASKP